jgi:hypothetical protein
MDGIDLLRREALARRNAVILAAKREYQATLREIGLLSKRLNLKRRGRPPKIVSVENALLRPTTVARQILDEGKPMTLVELTIEVQRRGCRPLDHPSLVAKAIDGGLRNHGKRYRKDGGGRWALRT